MRTATKTCGALTLGALLLALVCGCATAPWGQSVLRVPPGVTLPVRARVAVQVDPGMVNTQTVEFRGETWQYPDAELMQHAAIRVFREIFTEVGLAPSMNAPSVTIRVSGSSSLNPVMTEYYANATATIFPGGDTYTQPLGTISGSGTADQEDFSQGGIASAYEGALRQIGSRMLADPRLLAKIRAKP
jgi:ABC-type phosphate transport system substrate-binding protein